MTDVRERVAIDHAGDKFLAMGVSLPFPHASQVQGDRTRELRPRAGGAAGACFSASLERSSSSVQWHLRQGLTSVAFSGQPSVQTNA